MKFIDIFLLAILLTAPAFARADVQAEHQHTATNHTKLKLNNGKKWNTDETLRHAMTHIQSSVTGALSDIHAGKLSSAQYDALSKDVAGQITFIIGNCKLDPAADQQLHFIIGGIANGIEMMKAKKSKQKKTLGVQRIAESLNDYGKYFDHPDWQTLKLGAH